MEEIQYAIKVLFFKVVEESCENAQQEVGSYLSIQLVSHPSQDLDITLSGILKT